MINRDILYLYHVKMFRYRGSVLHKSKKIFNSLFICKKYERTKYIISQHTSFTIAICTERVNCIQLSMQQRLLLLLKTFRHSIYVLIIVVLHCFINLELNLGLSTLIDIRNWRQWYYTVTTVNETFHPCNVTARNGSHLVTSSFVRRQQCVLLSVIYSLDTLTYLAFSKSINTQNTFLHISHSSHTQRTLGSCTLYGDSTSHLYPQLFNQHSTLQIRHPSTGTPPKLLYS